MSQANETFFTTVGCMDGRAQNIAADFGRTKFGGQFPDTITEAGLVGLLGKEPVDQALLKAVKKKVLISVEKHHSKGIIVHGHQECAGNPVEDERHKENIRKSVGLIKSLINSSVPVVGAFIKHSSQNPSKWEIEEV